MKRAFLVTLSVVLLIVVLFSFTVSKESNSKINEGCKCYNGDKAYSPGSELCLGGHKAKCVAKEGVGDNAKGCGWNYLKDPKGNDIKCQ